MSVPVVEQFEYADLLGLASGLHGFAEEKDHLEREGNLQVGFGEELGERLGGISIFTQF